MCGISSSIINLDKKLNQKIDLNEIEHLIKKKNYLKALNKTKDLRNNNTYVNLTCTGDQKNFLKIKEILKKCLKIRNSLKPFVC